MTNIELLELDRLPAHLVILGGGYVCLEFAQAYRRFGSRVTVIEHGPQLLGREDPDVAEELRRILGVEGRSGDGVRLRVRTRTTGATAGFMKVLVEARGDRILGFAMLGPEAGEAMAVVQTAMPGPFLRGPIGVRAQTGAASAHRARRRLDTPVSVVCACVQNRQGAVQSILPGTLLPPHLGGSPAAGPVQRALCPRQYAEGQWLEGLVS